MKIYEKPVVSVDAGMMEGVYMQSGGASSTSGGFTVSFFNKNVYYQENGAETYRASWSSGNVKSITLVFNQNIDSATANIHQTPQIGRGDYRIQVNGQHHSDHTKEAQTLTISFNQPVTYSSSQGTLAGATTGTTLTINYTYHQNPNDNIGLGDLVVVSDPGLSITGVSITD